MRKRRKKGKHSNRNDNAKGREKRQETIGINRKKTRKKKITRRQKEGRGRRTLRRRKRKNKKGEELEVKTTIKDGVKLGKTLPRCPGYQAVSWENPLIHMGVVTAKVSSDEREYFMINNLNEVLRSMASWIRLYALRKADTTLKGEHGICDICISRKSV